MLGAQSFTVPILQIGHNKSANLTVNGLTVQFWLWKFLDLQNLPEVERVEMLRWVVNMLPKSYLCSFVWFQRIQNAEFKQWLNQRNGSNAVRKPIAHILGRQWVRNIECKLVIRNFIELKTCCVLVTTRTVPDGLEAGKPCRVLQWPCDFEPWHLKLAHL